MVGGLLETAGGIARACGGTLIGIGDDGATGPVFTDSRVGVAGGVFVAIRGETFDGHDYAPRAVAEGASVAIVERSSHVAVEPRIEVDDTLRALRDLAAARRTELRATVTAVTGSTGKTSTKDLLAAAMPDSWASPRSFNNEVGVPLTILGAPRDTRHLVVEVGSRGKGHIEWLAPAIRPDIAIITNIGVVHMETFGTDAGLRDAKWELAQAVGANGTVVLPHGDADLRSRPTSATVVTFGPSPDASVSYSGLTLDDDARPTFTLHTDRGDAPVSLPLAGAHHADNAAAAVAAGLAAGVDLDRLAEGLARVVPSAWRMEIHRGPVTVVNDAYNANPTSMEAALRATVALGGRPVAVLGKMAELGRLADEEHARIGALVRELGFAAVVVVGDDHGLAEAIGPVARRVASVDEALPVCRSVVREGDIVLVKASRSVGLERVAAELIGASG